MRKSDRSFTKLIQDLDETELELNRILFELNNQVPEVILGVGKAERGIIR